MTAHLTRFDMSYRRNRYMYGVHDELQGPMSLEGVIRAEFMVL
jgi:hypothetical protein